MSTAQFRAEPRARGVPAERPRVRRGRDRAVRRAVGPRPPLPGRRRAEDGQARAVRAHLARGVRRRGGGRRLHQPLRGDRGDRPGRPVDGDHPRGRGRPRASTRSSPTAPTSRSRPGCPTSSPARRSPASASPSRAPAPTPGRRRPRPSWSGRRVGGQRRQAVHHQLRLRDHQRRRGHRPHRHPLATAATSPSSARSWCRPAPPASPPRSPTTSSAGTPPTRTR